ncbi:exosortase A [Novosphingobium sp.]|uniref:exosortase A n=1 Tax=Novosphingobium sp. TaxID=1874826 RepID=UPI003D0CB293
MAIGPARALPVIWRAPLVQLAAVWAGLIVLFLGDWSAMAKQWWGSSTYNHILLVPPILGWMIAQRRHEVLRLTPVAWGPALLVFAGAGLLWLLGDFAGVAAARQLAVVVMAQASFAAIMGPEVVAGLMFPLCYMLFLVPMGDELIPALQTMTASLTMVFLHAAHVPATINGVFITTPAGYFQVAEACSGVKFLIAMVAYGALVANVCFVRWPRRLAFMAVSVVVPIIANGLRAFGTIWIAGWYGMTFASSFDHVFYGWVFFAVVMALCMAVGWRFFDRSVDAPMIDPVAIAASPLVRRLRAMALPARAAIPAMLAMALVCLAWGASAQMRVAQLPQGLPLPQIKGWEAVPRDSGVAWNPLHGGADRHLRMRLRNAAGQTVDLSFALYASQHTGNAAGGFGQGDLPLGSPWAWVGPGYPLGIAKSEVIQAPGPSGPEHRICGTWYRSGGLLTGSNLALRLHAMVDHLLLRRRATAVVILSASDRFNRDPAAAVIAFTAATGPLDRWIDGMVTGS